MSMIFVIYAYSHDSVDICDPTPANEALCGKINVELWAKMYKVRSKFLKN